MEPKPLEPVGVELTGLSLGDLDTVDADRLKGLLARHGVLVMRGQQIGDATFIAFLRLFGPLAFTTGETPVPGSADLNLVTNVGRTRPPRSRFHVDTSYVVNPPAYTALRAVEVPSRGGATLFSDQYRAHDTLPASVRHQLAGRTITHVVTGLDLPDGAERSAEHPVLRPHPISGRTALYLSTPERCASISALSAAEGSDLIDFLYRHSTRPDNLYRHHWAPDDVVMWDNACVMHRADHQDVQGDRVMHRGMVEAASSANRTQVGPTSGSNG